jgi:glyoxylase-like metal-dependent hydrolase (beta-lactamase superfamily II)
MTLASLTVLEAGYCQCPGGLARGYGSWRNIRFPALFALLEHPRYGRVLYDTGYSAEFFEATRRLPYRLYRSATPVTLAGDGAAVSQLAARGLAPADIDQVFISHFHPDHISALNDFPKARYRYWPEAYAAVRDRKGFGALSAGSLPDLIPNDFDARAEPLPRDQERPLPPEYAPFRSGVDVFGDESVFAVRLPGHAHGQMGLLARTAAGVTFFLVADACWHSGAYRDNRLPHPLANLIFANPAEYRLTLGQIHQFHQQAPGVIVIPSHCDEAAEKYVKKEQP